MLPHQFNIIFEVLKEIHVLKPHHVYEYKSFIYYTYLLNHYSTTLDSMFAPTKREFILVDQTL